MKCTNCGCEHMTAYNETKQFMINELGITKEWMETQIQKTIESTIKSIIGNQNVQDRINNTIDHALRSYEIQKIVNDAAKTELVKQLSGKIKVVVDIDSTIRKDDVDGSY